MEITKFAQSCVMIESNGKKIIVDPGIIGLDDEVIKKWKNVDYVFVTHKHGDHFSQEAFDKIKKDTTKIYSSQEVANAFSKTNFEIIKEGEKFELDEIKVEVVKAVHGYLPILKGDKAINENIGFVIEIEGKKLYFTSDTIGFPNPAKCDILFVPVSNHGLVMGAFGAAQFAKETAAKLVIPIHQNNPTYPVDFEKVKIEFDKENLNYKILEIGENFEIEEL
jgi:L-ascorbate metabolism protein UlaG (beta-lactamase superfamily)